MSRSKYIFIGALIGFIFGIIPYISIILVPNFADSWMSSIVASFLLILFRIVAFPLILINNIIFKAEGMEGLVYFIIAPVIIYPFIGALVGYFVYGRLSYRILKIVSLIIVFLVVLTILFFIN